MSVDFTNANFAKNSSAGNNSGGGANTPVPDEVAKHFNWGAFTLSWIWGVCNKTYITLLVFVLSFLPFSLVFHTIAGIFFGIKGNEWAWQNKRWESIEQFHDYQKRWARAGVVLFVCGILCFVIRFLQTGSLM